MSDFPDVAGMQRGHLGSFVGRQMWAIVDLPDGKFGVYWHDAGSVGPRTDYNSKRQAVARLLQLIGTGPVAPQTWPEKICISTVTLARDEAMPPIPANPRDAVPIPEPSPAMMGSGVGRLLRALSDIMPDDETVQEIRDWADFIVREIYFAMMGAEEIAQGIEAEGRDPKGLGAEHESPVAEGDAP